MADIIVKTTTRHKHTYTEYLHKCGEVVKAITSGSTIIGYADISNVVITVCPHCLEVISFSELQLPQNVKTLGWS